MPDRSTQDRSRRRFARRQWARRWLSLRKVLVAVLVVGGIAFAFYGLYFSPWLRVEGAAVTGTSQLTDAEVVEAAEIPTGDALVRADLAAIEARIEGRLTAVRSVDASRQWPHDIQIEIEEWRPLAVVDEGASYSLLAESGDTFTYPGMPARPPAELPRVVVGSGADRLALEEAAEVVAALDPAVAQRVDHITVDAVDDIVLSLREGQQVTWGSAEQSDAKAEVLLNLLDVKPDADTYDVSVPGMPAAR